MSKYIDDITGFEINEAPAQRPAILDKPLPTPPLEAEYPAGWWVLYVVVGLLSMLAAAIWPEPWFVGWLP